MHTINTQAIVGANLIFLDVAPGFPECMHDARVLQHTALFPMARQGEISSKPSNQINNVIIKPVLLGEGGLTSFIRGNQIENISKVIIPCFALNNFCQLENEKFIEQDGILDDLIRQERVARNKKPTKRK